MDIITICRNLVTITYSILYTDEAPSSKRREVFLSFQAVDEQTVLMFSTVADTLYLVILVCSTFSKCLII